MSVLNSDLSEIFNSKRLYVITIMRFCVLENFCVILMTYKRVLNNRIFERWYIFSAIGMFTDSRQFVSEFVKYTNVTDWCFYKCLFWLLFSIKKNRIIICISIGARTSMLFNAKMIPNFFVGKSILCCHLTTSLRWLLYIFPIYF